VGIVKYAGSMECPKRDMKETGSKQPRPRVNHLSRVKVRSPAKVGAKVNTIKTR